MGPGGIGLLRLDLNVHTRFSKESASPVGSLVSHCRDKGRDRAVKAVEMAGRRPNRLLLMVSGYVNLREVLV